MPFSFCVLQITDNSGTITRSEMHNLLRDLRTEAGGALEEDIARVASEMNAEAISFPEFVKLYVELRQQVEEIPTFVPGLGASIAAVYCQDQGKYYFFNKSQMWAMQSGGKLSRAYSTHAAPWSFPEGFQVDAATYNPETKTMHFFGGDRVIAKVLGKTLGRPKPIATWPGVPAGLDAGVYCNDSKTHYFFKDGTYYGKKDGYAMSIKTIHAATFALPKGVELVAAVYNDDEKAYYLFEKHQYWVKKCGVRTNQTPQSLEDFGCASWLEDL